MSRLAKRFAELKTQGRKALIPYVTAGDPAPNVTVPLMHALVQSGADILEFGVPFSDPMAEGPVIQRAMERALRHRVSLKDVLKMVAEFRQQDPQTPIVLMGYLNPVEVMGYARFAQAAKDAGVDAVLTVDLPVEESEDMLKALRRHELDPIFLLSPTSSPERIARIVAAASGFVYYVSLRGVTGAAHLDLKEVAERVATIRRHTDLPVGVGFGINTPEAAARVAQIADAVVVGSAMVKRIADLVESPERIAPDLGSFVAELRRAMDNTGTSERTHIRGARA